MSKKSFAGLFRLGVNGSLLLAAFLGCSTGVIAKSVAAIDYPEGKVEQENAMPSASPSEPHFAGFWLFANKDSESTSENQNAEYTAVEAEPANWNGTVTQALQDDRHEAVESQSAYMVGEHPLNNGSTNLRELASVKEKEAKSDSELKSNVHEAHILNSRP